MVLLMSSAGKEPYQQFILKVLCYPRDFTLADVPYSLPWVNDFFARDPAELVNKAAIICFVEYVPQPQGATLPIDAMFLPLRQVLIEGARRFAGKILLRVRLGDFIYYDESARIACRGNKLTARVLAWNSAIKALPESPRAVPRAAGGTVDVDNPNSWRSGGKLVIEIPEGALDFGLSTSDAEAIRAQCDDWKSTVDVMAERKQLQDKLFYQIGGLQHVDGRQLSLTTRDQKSIYVLNPGENVDLVLHFYYGEHSRPAARRILEIVTPSELLSVVGGPSVEVDPGQFSGKIETVRLRAKRQLAEEFAYITIKEKEPTAPTTPALVSTELYVRIRPAWWYVGAILALFFVGTLLSGIPTDMKPPTWVPPVVAGIFTPWMLKIIGAGMMALMLRLSFSKLPSKAGG